MVSFLASIGLGWWAGSWFCAALWQVLFGVEGWELLGGPLGWRRGFARGGSLGGVLGKAIATTIITNTWLDLFSEYFCKPPYTDKCDRAGALRTSATEAEMDVMRRLPARPTFIIFQSYKY